MALVLLSSSAAAFGRGVTAYLPLNLEPEMESQIERVLILADRPVLRRPIPVAVVTEALPRACRIDLMLCRRVTRYLARYASRAALTHVDVEGAVAHGANIAIPDRYGVHDRSDWNASFGGYLQPNDHLLISAGAVGYQGRTDFTGSVLSVGFSKAQLDIGYKPRWLSPLTDSSMLMSTEAPTMPSVGLASSEPLTRLGLSYEVFEARMSRSDHILYQDGLVSGYPRLGGVQLSIEPVSGWALGLNRLVQFGGGPRGGSSPTDLLRAFFNPSNYESVNPGTEAQPSNEETSITSSLLIPGAIPFAVYAEYAGEDTLRGRSYLFGNAALSWGLHLPRLLRYFDLTLEASEWQNAWYVHQIWQDGMTNDMSVISNWFGDQRIFGDGVGGRSAMVRLAWDPWFGGQLAFRYRALQNQSYGVIPYHRLSDSSLSYAHPLGGLIVGAEVDTGTDVLGQKFTRLAGFVRYNPDTGTCCAVSGDDLVPGNRAGGSLLLNAGVSLLRIRTDLTGTSPTSTAPAHTGSHVALGALRAVTEHSDLGARVELDELGGRSLAAVRLVDYRYRWNGPLALTGFLGAARYALATPAYGLYYGTGVQWRDVVPHIDLGAEVRYYDNVSRDHLLASDPHSVRPDSFYDIWGGVLSLTYNF